MTVVIPFYSKRRGLLIRAVESVLKQSYQDFKVIVVDDCSPVCAKAELSSVDDSRVEIIKNETNMNGAYSRNRGIEYADTKYVALLDADDFYLDDHLQVCIDGVGDRDFIYSNLAVLRGGVIEKINTSDVSDYTADKICNILLDFPPQTNSFFFKRSCYPEVRFNERLKRHQDYQIFIDFCRSRFKVGKVDSYTSCYVPDNVNKNVDYDSVLDFWLENKKYASPEKLNKFMVCIALGISKQEGAELDRLIFIKERLVVDPVYNFILRFNHKPIIKSLLFLYYHAFLDLENLWLKVRRKLAYIKRNSIVEVDQG